MFKMKFRSKGSALREFGAAPLAVGVLGMVLAAAAAADDTQMKNEAGLGAASAALSLIYGPAKLVYAGGGSVIAGMAYVVSGGDKDVAKPILDAAMRGDYVVTPEILKGERRVEFVGRSPERATLADDPSNSSGWEATQVREEPAEQDDYGPWQEPTPKPATEPRDAAWATP